MIKKILSVGIVVVMVAASYALYLYNLPAKTAVGATADITMSAEDLITKFDSESEVATTLLSDIIEVTGTITLIEKGELTSIIVINERITCEVENAQIDSTITTGSQVTIRGIYSGLEEMFNEIILSKCVIVKQS
ncbi:OB-fold protein [Dokdonia sp. Asnod2-E02]|uniref:OB-fold protein n=1 Tax=Dokdonia sp. Asnod2-E02 TaxID=3160574 RepID=UPI00386F5716